jgi:hypothetical protein
MDNEEEQAIALLRRLDDEPGTPSRVDLGRAITEGGRRRRTRRALGGGGAVVLAAAMVATVPVALTALRPASTAPNNQAGAATVTATRPASTVVPPTRCSVQRLPLLDGEPMSLVTGADPTGRFIVGRTYPNGHNGVYPILMWDNGKPSRIVLPGADQLLSDVTTTGVAVGSGWGDKGPRSYIYRDGKVSLLPAAGSSQAEAINDAGQIVGSRDEGAAGSKPVIWRDSSAQPVDLPLPASKSTGQATDIDENGTVIGTVWESPTPKDLVAPKDPAASNKSGVTGKGMPRNPSTGYLWLPDGTARELPKPMVQGARADYFLPRSIRNGWITGTATRMAADGTEIRVPARLYLPTNEFVDFPTSSFQTDGGNGQGWVVGVSSNQRLALLTDAGLVNLPEIEPHEPANGDRVVNVSDDGRIVAGQNEDSKNVIQAVVWNCR